MINLDERYHSYLSGQKKFRIDNVEECVKGYGFECDGSSIIGYYVLTENYRLSYNLKEQFKYMEPLV
jgi:hypothetical protein